MIINIDYNNLHVLKKFVSYKLPDTFRYFDKRTVLTIQNHKVTIVYIEDDIPVGYGHLDEDKGIIWLGICVIESFQGRGIGKSLIINLLDRAKSIGINTIYLTVDIVNVNAIYLYKKYGFIIHETHLTYYVMKLCL